MEESLDEQRWRLLLVITMTVMTIIAFGYAIIAARHAAWVPDLYNLVYNQSRPWRGEATGTFLFCFPTALAIGTVMARAPRVRSNSSIPEWMTARGSHAFSLCWALFFFAASINRSHAVLAFFR